MKTNYLEDIPDEYLEYMAMYHWDKLRQMCVLLTLDLETEGLKN